jgi:hypothetical protein
MAGAVASTSARVSSIASGREAAEKMRAIVPATCGAAMLVPLLTVSASRVRPSAVRTEEQAARIPPPGAASSGFGRPSRVGPTLLNGSKGPPGRRASYAPTAIVFRPLQIVFVLTVGSA